MLKQFQTDFDIFVGGEGNRNETNCFGKKPRIFLSSFVKLFLNLLLLTYVLGMQLSFYSFAFSSPNYRGCMMPWAPISYSWGNFTILALGVWAVAQRDSIDAILMVSFLFF